MCKVLLAGSKRNFEYLKNVIVLDDRIDVYDFQEKIILTLPQGNMERNEFETLSFIILDSLSCCSDSINFNTSKGRIACRSFYFPDIFFNDMRYICDSLKESLKLIKKLERVGVNTSGMIEFANKFWHTRRNA